MKEKAIITAEQEKYLLENAPELLENRDDFMEFGADYTAFLAGCYDDKDHFTKEGLFLERMYDAILEQTYEAREN